jgi:hypothetical protein
MNIFEWLANEQIEEALRRGDFDNLPGKGRPLNLEEDDHIPPDMRMAYHIMKNAGVSPPEISLRKELETIKAELSRAKTDEERRALEKDARMMCLRISLMMEPRARRK